MMSSPLPLLSLALVYASLSFLEAFLYPGLSFLNFQAHDELFLAFKWLIKYWVEEVSSSSLQSMVPNNRRSLQFVTQWAVR